MKKYYYNDFLIRKSNNDYSFAFCSFDESKKSIKVYSCHGSLELARIDFKREATRLDQALQSWKKVLDAPEEWSATSIEEARAFYTRIKRDLDTLSIIKLEAR